MNKEEKELLLMDLCARLPYGVFVEYDYGDGVKRVTKFHGNYIYLMMLGKLQWKDFKPYIRPMSSMTEEEQKVFSDIESEFLETLVKKVQQIKNDNERRHLLQKAVAKRTSEMVQFYNKSHLDYNGLIEKGLALEAPKGMYETPNMKESRIMTEQEKQLSLKYLCAILPYGVKYCREYWDYERDQEMCAVGTLESIDKDGYINDTKVYTVWDIKPYLRQMSSMTEEEVKELEDMPRIKYIDGNFAGLRQLTLINEKFADWLHAHHFDYLGLIKKGLALEAPEEMYKI